MDLATKAKVEIMGRQYTLRGDADSDYMVSLAHYVDKKMLEIRNHTKDSDSTRLALLVALNIADELFQLRNNSEIDEIEERTRAMITMLERGMVGIMDIPKTELQQ